MFGLADFKFEFSSSYAGLDEVITHKVSMMVYAVSTYIYTEKNSEASDYSLKIINFLIKRGSNLNEVVNNKTILFYATPNPSLFTYLLERGARLSAKEYLILSKQKDSVPDSLILNIYEIYLEKDKLNHSLKDNRKPKLPTSKLKL